MNLTIKSLLLDAVLSLLLTIIGGGNFYSFLFFMVLLFLPAVLVFVSIETVAKTKSKSKKDV